MTLKVLNIIQRYSPAKGGAELFSQILSEYLVKGLGYEVDVWTTDALAPETLWDLDGERIKERYENINGVNVERFRINHRVFKYIDKAFREVFKHFPNWRVKSIATCPTVFTMLLRAMFDRSLEYDVVTVSTTPYFFLFYVGYIISKRLDIPLVIAPALHPGLEEKDSLRKKYLGSYVVKYFEYADRIILNTEEEGRIIKEFSKKNGVDIDSDKMIVIGQGVFMNDISNGNGKRFREKYHIKEDIVFQIGTKTRDKGSFNLIDAMKIIWDKGFKTKLVFGGAYSEDHTEYINSLDERYRENILSIDNISEEDKWDLFDAGDIFSMVSKTDSFGIVYLEAWTYRKPVLACRNNIMSNVIDDNENGMLVTFDDINELAKKLELLLNNLELRKSLGENGYRKVKSKYDWNRNLKRVGDLYNKLLN